MNFLSIIFCAFFIFSCSQKSKEEDTKKVEPMDTPAQTASVNYKPVVIGKISHDPEAYTQGLYFHEGYLYESTGHYGKSSIRKINPENGEIVKKKDIFPAVFGEGLTILNDKLYCLTWLENTCLVYDLKTFDYIKQFQYTGEGWGITHDGTRLIMSNGTSWLYFRNESDFSIHANMQVKDKGYPLTMLNELEYVDGLIYANIYQLDEIAVIEAKTGNVLALIDFSFLRNEVAAYPNSEVLNGIAYDKEKNRFFITGKNWPYIFIVEIQRT